MSKFGVILSAVLYFACVALLLALILGAPVMLLWNAIMPVVFGLSKLLSGKLLG